MALHWCDFTGSPAWIFAACAAFSVTAAADIRVFTNGQFPIIAGPGIRIIDLDAPTQLQTELFQSLPADPAQATVLAQARLKHQGTAFQRRLAIAYEGVIEAKRLGIAKIPAVVVDRRYVVYGESEVRSAIARITAFRETQR